MEYATIGLYPTIRYVRGVANKLCMQMRIIVTYATHCTTSVLHLDNLPAESPDDILRFAVYELDFGELTVPQVKEYLRGQNIPAR